MIILTFFFRYGSLKSINISKTGQIFFFSQNDILFFTIQRNSCKLWVTLSVVKHYSYQCFALKMTVKVSKSWNMFKFYFVWAKPKMTYFFMMQKKVIDTFNVGLNVVKHFIFTCNVKKKIVKVGRNMVLKVKNRVRGNEHTPRPIATGGV